MIRCYLTGVQIPIENAMMLNRREALNQLTALREQLTSLQRTVDQFSPMDDMPQAAHPAFAKKKNFASKKHRLVCKAVADALAAAWPGTKMFIAWGEYTAQVRVAKQRQLRADRKPAATAPINAKDVL